MERVLVNEGRATGALLRGGETLQARHVILAVPHWLVLDLLPEECRTHPDMARITELETAPISSVHLWFDRPVLFPSDRAEGNADGAPASPELPHAVLIGRLSQWVFNRSLLQKPEHERSAGSAFGSRDTAYSYQVVISASRNVAGKSQQEVIAAVVDELGQIFRAAERRRSCTAAW